MIVDFEKSDFRFAPTIRQDKPSALKIARTQPLKMGTLMATLLELGHVSVILTTNIISASNFFFPRKTDSKDFLFSFSQKLFANFKSFCHGLNKLKALAGLPTEFR